MLLGFSFQASITGWHVALSIWFWIKKLTFFTGR